MHKEENRVEVREPEWCEELDCMVQLTIHWGEKEFDPIRSAVRFMNEMEAK